MFRSPITLAAISGLAAATTIVCGSGKALAGYEIYDDSVSTCTGINCSSLRIPATLFGFGASAASWQGSFFAAPGECVRIDVISPIAAGTVDLETVTVAPNGTVYRNDDGGGGGRALNPVVKIASAPNNGWYTVRIGQYAGTAVNANFVVAYGRYNAGNPNCAGATTPVSATSSPTKLTEPRVPTQAAPDPNAPGS
ncbi:MAG: hypothetical protein KME17_16005 [Cyanosarcina radialis HA8281-LM2]|jgi:hypothetical protein|nr:hypothetical protein [Cyanosarcina radialis HA8281-LM2]